MSAIINDREKQDSAETMMSLPHFIRHYKPALATVVIAVLVLLGLAYFSVGQKTDAERICDKSEKVFYLKGGTNYTTEIRDGCLEFTQNTLDSLDADDSRELLQCADSAKNYEEFHACGNLF